MLKISWAQVLELLDGHRNRVQRTRFIRWICYGFPNYFLTHSAGFFKRDTIKVIIMYSGFPKLRSRRIDFILSLKQLTNGLVISVPQLWHGKILSFARLNELLQTLKLYSTGCYIIPAGDSRVPYKWQICFNYTCAHIHDWAFLLQPTWNYSILLVVLLLPHVFSQVHVCWQYSENFIIIIYIWFHFRTGKVKKSVRNVLL